MKLRLCLVAALTLTACSDAPTTETKAPPPPPEPLTGRQAFQQTYPPARIWAGDCQPIRIRSFNLDTPKSAEGKAGAWEILYVSAGKGRTRPFTWSAVDAGASLHRGVFAGHEEPWNGPQGLERPFVTAAIKIDTPEALQTAIAKSPDYMQTPGVKPMVNFMLEATSRFPDPAWRVFWGPSVASAEWSVFIDATLGQYLGR